MRKQCFIDQIVISVLNRKAINECPLGRWADREAVSYWLMRDPCHRGLHGLRFAPRQNKNRLQRGDPMRADRPEEMMKGDRWFESRSLHRRVRELSVPPEKKSDRAVARCRRSGMTVPSLALQACSIESLISITDDTFTFAQNPSASLRPRSTASMWSAPTCRPDSLMPSLQCAPTKSQRRGARLPLSDIHNSRRMNRR